MPYIDYKLFISKMSFAEFSNAANLCSLVKYSGFHRFGKCYTCSFNAWFKCSPNRYIVHVYCSPTVKNRIVQNLTRKNNNPYSRSINRFWRHVINIRPMHYTLVYCLPPLSIVDGDCLVSWHDSKCQPKNLTVQVALEPNNFPHLSARVIQLHTFQFNWFQLNKTVVNRLCEHN